MLLLCVTPLILFSIVASSGPLIARSQSYLDNCPAYLPTKVTRRRNVTNYANSSDSRQMNHEGLVSSRWKQVSEMMLVNDSTDSNFSDECSKSV